MLKRILSLDLNSKKVDAKRQDDWWFHEEPLNTPDTMVKCVITKIPGFIMAKFLTLIIFSTTLVLFITLPISRTNDNTLGESIFGSSELQREKNEK